MAASNVCGSRRSFQAQDVGDYILRIAPLNDEVRHRLMRGPQRDRERGRRHPGDVCDILEYGSRGIGGMGAPINAMALSALRLGQLAAGANAVGVGLRLGTTAQHGHRANESHARNNHHLHNTAHGMLLSHVVWGSQLSALNEAG
jgi:hypothetical protein